MAKIGARRSRASSARHSVGRPLAEILEARQLLAVITVTSAGDADGADGSSSLSLRQAIEIANGSLAIGSLTMGQASLVVGALSTPNTIDFDIPGTGPFTITPATNLPTITRPVVINGYSQPGAQPNTNSPTQADNAILKIELIGSTGTTTGLQITAGNSTVEGLSIGGFATASVELDGTDANLGAGSNLVAGDFLGIDTTGTHAIPSSQVGLFVSQSDSNTIGGTTAAARDVISGNSAANLGIYDASEDNLVEGNLIGTDATGAVASPNQINGIDDLSSGSNTIGGTVAGARNVISGNGNSGVYLSAVSDVVEGNYIGTDITGSTAIQNGGDGVDVENVGSDTIGGSTAGAGNVISGNNLINTYKSALYVATPGNLIEGNLIGTDATGTKVLSGHNGQVWIASGQANTIGGTVAGARNVISTEVDGASILIDTSDNLIEGNFIGTDITGTVALPGFGGEIAILTGPSNTIGGTAIGAGNVISGSGGYGLVIGSASNLVEGNRIGTDVTGTKALPNVGGGIQVTVSGAEALDGFNTIGGTIPGAGNIISGNGGDGIDLSSTSYDDLPGDPSSSANNLIEGNLIGTDVTGTEALPNLNGIQINGSGPNTIGGSAPGARNVISGNMDDGVNLLGYETLVEGNLVGTDITGSVALPNGSGGIHVNFNELGTPGQINTIGGTNPGAGNVISGNGGNGIDLTAGYLLIEGNRIGTDISGSLAIPNQVYGIDDEVGGSCTIGGTVPGAGNLISGNGQDGIELLGSSNSIEGNRIGTDITGTFAVPNGLAGIELGSGTVDTIGGTASGAGNLISGNTDAGIDVSNLHGLIEGNLIGTDVKGTEPIPNGEGIRVNSYGGPTIGGTTPGARNVISGNTNTGIDLVKGGGLVEGNFIGTDVSGTKALPNGMDGIIDDGFSTIGGTTAGSGNVISSNSHDGIFIDSPQNLIEGNFIGTDATGSKALPNQDSGILVQGGLDIVIGGTVPGAGNLISGNSDDGISINSSDTLVEGNLIGTDVTGAKAIPNGADGLFEDGNGNSSTIGGTAAGDRNVISGNLASGLELLGSNNLIEGNFVGTDVTGTKALGNENWGMYVQGGSDDVIGGTAEGAGNVVSGNQFQGLLIDSSKALLEGNFVGTDVTGSRAIPNVDCGVEVGGSYGGNTVGGTVAGARNVISGNAAGGLLIGYATNDLVEGNRIGTDVTGTRSVANTGYGIEVIASTLNTIGGTTPGAWNVISGNNGNGVLIYGSSFHGLPGPQATSAANLVEGNLIGTDVTGANPLPNVSAGIAIDGSGNSGNTIGGTAAGAGNVIAFNGGAGVGIASVTSSYPQDANIDNPITGNAIYANGALGIDLGDDGVTPNNPAGSPEGANLLQPYPVITSAIDSATTTTVEATIAARPSTTYTIEFFANPLADPSGFGQGQFDLGTEVVTTDAAGNASFTFSTTSARPGQTLSATATDPAGNTSEFAQDLLVGSATTTALTVPMSPVYIGQPLTLLATVAAIPGSTTPTGDVAFTEDGQFLGSAALDASGVASFTLTATAGSHTYEVVYLGSPQSSGSTSNPVVVTAVAQASTTTLVAPISPAKFGQVLTFAASVAPTIGGVPTGLVYFGANSVILGTAFLNASGVATFSTTSLPVGVSVVEAYYAGDASHAPSLSNFASEDVVDDGPTVISDQVETSTKVKITFSQPLLAARAQDRANYAIAASSCDTLTILSAAYDPTDSSVTLTTRQSLTPGKTYQLMINGVNKGRVEDINQIPLAGKRGKPGTSYVGKITPQAPKVTHAVAAKGKRH